MLVIVQNDPEVPPGTYGDYLRQSGIAHAVCRAWEGEALQPPSPGDAVIVLGGAMGVHETDAYPFLLEVKRFVREVLDTGIPYLGICLGGQLLAEGAGGLVTPSSGLGEKGIHLIDLSAEGKVDPLFAGIAAPFHTFQWHDDSFDLANGAAHLAFSTICRHQAFRIGSAYGLQFHPEVDEAIVHAWAAGSAETADEADDFVSSFRAAGSAYSDPSMRILRNFLEIAGISPC